MTGRLRVLLAMSLLGMLILLALSAQASYVDLAVIATYEDRVYDIGDVVDVRIETLRNGERYDGGPTVWCGFGYPQDRGRPEKVSTGVYVVNYTVKEDKLTAWGSSSFSVTIGEDGNHASEQYFVRTPLTDTFQVQMFVPDPEDDTPRPGQTVEFEIRSTFRGEPVNLDFGYPEAIAGPRKDGSIMDAVEVKVDRTDTGVYEGRYTVPSHVNVSTRFDIDVQAACTIGEWEARRSSFHVLSVNFLDVWVHVAEVTDEGATVQLVATDLDGVPAGGASVNFAIVTWPMYDWYPLEPIVLREFNATIDELGRATVVVDLGEMTTRKPMRSFIATLRQGSYSQVVGGRLVMDEWSQGGDWAFEGGYVNMTTQLPLPPEEEVTLEYEGWMREGSFAFDTLCMMVHDAGTVYWAGTVDVDGEGRFAITITTPDVGGDGLPYAILDVEFRGLWNGSEYWSEWDDVIVVYGEGPLSFWDRHADVEASITVEPVHGSRNNTVALEFPGADGTDEKVSVLWGLELPTSMTDWQVWRKLTPRPDNYHLDEWKFENCVVYSGEYIWATHVAPCIWEDGRYVVKVRIPDALPAGLRIYLLGVIETYDDSVPRTVLFTFDLDGQVDWPKEGPDDVGGDPDPSGSGSGEPANGEEPAWLPSLGGAGHGPGRVLFMIFIALTLSTILVKLINRMELARRD